MPRVVTRTKAARGADRTCGRCGRTIEAGEKYRQWGFRYGGMRYRCGRPECAPRPSDLTQSLMGDVYRAQEDFHDQADSLETVDDVRTAVQEVADAAREVMEQYEQAAEPFGGAGENQERADELSGWVSELESFYPDEGESDQDAVNAARAEAAELVDGCPL